MAPQLDQGSQRRPQAVFFFNPLSGLSVSSCYCLGMPQFWHRRSEVTRPQEPSRSFSPMHCHYDSPLTRVPVTRPRHSRHSHPHACEYAEPRLRADAYFYRWQLLGPSSTYKSQHLRWCTKTSNSIWDFILTSIVTQYLLENGFYLTVHVQKGKHSLTLLSSFKFSGSIFGSVGQQVTVIISVWHIIVDLSEADLQGY